MFFWNKWLCLFFNKSPVVYNKAYRFLKRREVFETEKIAKSCSSYIFSNTFWYKIPRNIHKILIGFWTIVLCLNLKQLERQFNPPCSFSKNVSSKERLKRWFFVTFNIIIGHIFPKNFIEIPQGFQKTWNISLSTLAISIYFYQFFGFFDISLFKRN